jgi:NDP-hexose 4-ketoreductase
VANALVIGSRGLIGRHIAAALDRVPGLHAVGVARPARRRSGPNATVELDLLTADISAITETIDAAGATLIVNCAGATVGTQSELLLANTVSVARLLEAIESAGAPPRLIHIGSSAEYGRGPVGRPVTEAAAASPVGPYGVSKLAATQLVAGAKERGAVDAVVLRVFNVVAPGMPNHSLPGGVLRRLQTATAEGSNVLVTGPLDSVRDFVDIRDVEDAVVAACLAVDTLPPVLNIASGTAHTARDLVNALVERMGFEGSIEERASGSSRSVDVPWQVADITLAKRTLDWRPSRDFASICDAAVSMEGA